MATTSSTSSTLNIAQGKVVALAGKIIAVMPDGTQHAVQVGEELASGVRLIIPADAFIELQSAGGDIVRIAEARDLTITDDVFPTQTAATDATDAALAPLQPEAQQVLAALQGGQDPLSQLEAAAAGLAGAAGGAEDGGNSYIILGRVSEGITGASLDLGIDNLGATGRAQTSELPVTNEPPTIVVEQPTNQGPDGVANDGLVYEAGLDPDGSAEVGDASSDAEFATGTFSISDPEGLGDIASITINGITIAIGSLDGATVPGAFGEITISYDPATGQGSYTYELTGPTTDIDNENVAETDTFSFFVTDNSGNNSGTAQMVVTIVDDEPSAIEQGEGNYIWVEEGGLGQGSEEDPADDDHSLGIPNPGDNDAASGISGDLNNLFKSGADVPLSFSISAANAALLPVLLSNGDPLSYSVSEDGLTLTATAGSGEDSRTVFTLTIDELGGWHFDLDDQLDHVEDGNTEGFGLITVSTSGEGPEYGSVYGIDFSSIIVATDADGDPAVGAVGGSFVVMVQDDVPEVVAQPRAISATVEEDDMTGIAGGDLSTGNNEDDSVNRDEADSTDHGSIATLFSAGADAPLSFSLATTTDSLPTLYSQGDAVSYRVEDNVLTAYVDGGEDPDRVVFTLTLDDNGGWSFDLQDQLDHVNDGANDENTALYTGEDSEPVSSIDFSSLLQATDADGDTVTLGERSGLFRIAIQDDVPVVTAISSLIYANSLNDGSSDAVGVFAYRLGADEWDDYSAQRSDFAAISLSGMVGELAISNTDVSWSSEDATTASFVIAFDYAANPDTPELLTHVTGSLVFDKEAGTYTLSLDDTIKGYTVLTTSNPIGERDSHDLTGSPQPEIVISQLDNNFYVRFSGGSGDFATSDGDMVLEDNEVFTGTQKWVSISGDENGIASDTLQRGEVLNMDFYTSNPGADPNPAAGDARADGIYLKLAKWIPGEDMLVLLKLIDPDNPLDTITRTIIVSSADIYTADEGNPYGITGADGVVIIESNDFNGAGENYQIYGIQLLVSSEDIIGSGIDLNRETGEAGGSSSMLDFDANPADTGTTDQDVIKIMDVGIITSQSYTQDAQLSFDVTLADADGDHSSSQQLEVYIASNGTLSGSAGADVMTGDSGPNSFVWHAGDASDTAGAPITDTVVNFSLAQGDSLDLHDLLQGEAGQDLGKYLHFSSDGNDTLIQVSSSGQFDGSNYSAVADQNILLQGVDLTTLGNDSQIIDQLKGGHNLQTD